MRKVPYSTSREALYHPEVGQSIFTTFEAASEDLLCAESARLVYKKCEELQDVRAEVATAFRGIGFDEFDFFCNEGSQALVAWNSTAQLAILAFRGTEQSFADFSTDFKTFPKPWPKGGKVHAGFMEALDWVWSPVDGWLKKHPGRLLMTGHSLGAALSTLAASLTRPARLVTFGSPKVGDPEFGRTLAGVQITRYMNCCDLISRVPPGFLGFEHVGALHYIDRLGRIKTGMEDRWIRWDGLMARLQYFLGFSWRVRSNVFVRGLADHTPLNYVYPILETCAAGKTSPAAGLKQTAGAAA